MAYISNAQSRLFARNQTLYGMKFLSEISICQTLQEFFEVYFDENVSISISKLIYISKVYFSNQSKLQKIPAMSARWKSLVRTSSRIMFHFVRIHFFVHSKYKPILTVSIR